MNKNDLIITVGVIVIGGLLIYFLVRRVNPDALSMQRFLQGAPNVALPASTAGFTGHTYTGGTGDYLRGADNIATGVCPAVGAYFGVTAGSQTGKICELSRKVDPVYYITDYGSKLLDKI